MFKPIPYKSLCLGLSLCTFGLQGFGGTERLSADQALARAESAVQKMGSGYLRDFAVTTIARERARQGDYERALQLAGWVERPEERDTVFLALATTQAEKNPDAAFVLSSKVVRAELRGKAQGVAALFKAKSGKFSEARAMASSIGDEGSRFSADHAWGDRGYAVLRHVHPAIGDGYRF